VHAQEYGWPIYVNGTFRGEYDLYPTRLVRESRAVGALGANTAEIPIARLIAEVTSPDGTTLAILERVAPRETSSGGSR
jgi:hypothetical protein